MSSRRSRRAFLHRAAAGMTAGWVAAGPLARWSPRAVAGQNSKGAIVKLRPQIEPVVRLLEETPRQKTIETVAARVRGGMEYRDLLAALLLAGVRNVEPRPSVGFKFHAVLVVQSVHLASMAAPRSDRWVPIFWALDYFKDCQAQDDRERGWTMGPVDESAVPGSDGASTAFTRAMDRWDEAAADAAVAGLARTAAPERIWETFFGYGARDYRSIGHKAIDVANSHRVLGVIGWQDVEPILRSLAYALLMHEDGNPADRDDPADRPWRRNQSLARRIPSDWQQGKASPEATAELLAALRTGSEEDAADKVVELAGRGVSAQSIWDGLMLGACELLVRQPGIVALHSVTTTNALHYAYRHARDDETRKRIVLQNAAFLPMFRGSMAGRGKVGQFAIDAMEPLEAKSGEGEAVDEIFADVARAPMAAARKTLDYFQAGGSLDTWTKKARELILSKSTGPHDYKFGMASLENAAHITPTWRARLLAAAVFALQGSAKSDNPLAERTKAAFARARNAGES